uniref:Cytochrome P450 n=1 Tax=Clastoptera arizonana TaxID=38151 RepID=A0A1B6EDM3_9HEMI
MVWLYVLLGLLSILYFLVTWNHSYWKKRGIPYLQPLPLVGNMLDSFLRRKNAAQIYADIYSKFPKEPICGFYKMLTPSLVIRSPKLIQQVLVKDFYSFHDNDIYMAKEVDPYINRNPFVSTGDDWKINRAAMSPAFTSGKLKNVFPLMKDISHQMEDYLDNNLSKYIEAKELAFLFSSDIIANCAFGIKSNSFMERDHLFQKLSEKLMENFHSPFFAFAITTLPALGRILKLRFVPEDVYKFLKEALMQVKEHREKNNIVMNDYADFILASSNKRMSNEENPEVVMLSHAVSFFLDGLETSSIAGSFVIYELALNPHIQDKLRQEISSVFKKRDDLDFEALQKLPYLHQVISEALRKYPPGLAVKKLCTQTVTLDVDGVPLTVHKGTPVAIPLYALHHDPDYYPDPDKFDPERFTEENIASRPQCTYLPFGEGPRMCVGFRFALLQIKLLIAILLLKYAIKSGDRTPKKINLNPLDLLASSMEGMYIKIEKY